ncbi:hypothetical protein B0T24DRAFT_602509 [Lasiosphaeria ovina]|uniref:Uncharacterized protein n=1 Tax=Lasiosphaeria ovina TaxID=92902 RepID=A0AAE0NJM5_9PEZI|nr:hypothetical protein B0T24DRAFT_602509 [Lasiosphaeria ovina]
MTTHTTHFCLFPVSHTRNKPLDSSIYYQRSRLHSDRSGLFFPIRETTPVAELSPNEAPHYSALLSLSLSHSAIFQRCSVRQTEAPLLCPAASTPSFQVAQNLTTWRKSRALLLSCPVGVTNYIGFELKRGSRGLVELHHGTDLKSWKPCVRASCTYMQTYMRDAADAHPSSRPNAARGETRLSSAGRRRRRRCRERRPVIVSPEREESLPVSHT